MSKLSFRARALDSSKPLPIYHARDVPDLSDYQAINRTVPQMPTGMEKEEETERHLQEVILAQQTNCHREVFIPTPEVSVSVTHYEQVYQKLPQRQSPYIRVPGLGLEEEVPDYDLDSEDEEWLNAQTKERPLSPLHFERMMDKLERGSGNTVLSVRDAQSLLKDEEDLVIAVYDYWLAKRLRLGRALIPAVKHERRDGTSSNSPYLAFRKRTEKMQTRKNRKNDETAYMQMLKLKRDLAKAKNLAEYILERESKKNDLAKIEADIFRQRFQLEDWSGNIMSSLRPVSTRSDTSSHAMSVGDGWDSRSTPIKMESEDHVQIVGRQPVLISSGLKRKSKKKKFYFPPGTPEPEPITPATPEKSTNNLHTMTVEKSDEEEPDGIFTFRRKPHVRYHKVLDFSDGLSWDLGNGVPMGHPVNRKRHRYCRTGFGGSYIGSARRRLGRGGRILWDRAYGSESEGEDNEEEPMVPAATDNKEDETSDPRLKRCQYISRSPSPTSNFEFQVFPLIENPDPSAPPTDPVTSMAIFEFGGFISDSEFPEDASSFSSLPTSQFALKPSSSDIECDNASSQEEAMDTSGPPAMSLQDRNNGRPPELHSLRTPLDRTTSSVDQKTSDVAISSLQRSVKTQPEVVSSQVSNCLTLKPPPSDIHQEHPPSQNLSAPLQNSQTSSTTAPVLIPPPSLLTVASLPKLTSALPHEVSKVPLVPAVDVKQVVINSTAKSGGLKGSTLVPLDPKGIVNHTPSKPVDPREKSRSLEQKAGSASGTVSTIPVSVNSGNGGTASLSVQVDSNLKSDIKPAQNGLATPQPLPPKSDNVTTADTSPPVSWLMDGPSNTILLLNSRRSSQSRPPQNATKTESMTDAASVITSQFLQTPVKEETSVPVRSSDQLATPVQTTRTVPLALSRDLHLPVVQGTVPMTSSRLPTSLPPTPITPKLDGHPQVFDKRATPTQNLVARRASTNGSNYPEIFHTARRFSETTERGLKQALAGINHNSLIDSAANSLVQPRANPSEVT